MPPAPAAAPSCAGPGPWGLSLARWRLAAALFAALALTQATWAAWSQGWTRDEPLHLGWSERFWDKGLSERSSNPAFNSKTPVVIPNALMQKAALARGADPRVARFLTRLPSVLWLLGILLAAFFLGRACGGVGTGYLAVVLSALDPNLVAHSSVVTVDAAFTFATMLVVAAELALWRRPTLPRAAAMGAALGLALVAKFTALLLLPAAAILPLLARTPVRRAARVRWATAAAAAALLAATCVLDAAYLFRDIGRPLGTVAWRGEALQAAARLTPSLALPVPGAFLEGIDASLANERGRAWNVIVFGRVHPNGAWYYFALHWLLKTPLALLMLLLLGFTREWRKLVSTFPPLWLLAQMAILLGYFSFVFRTQIGYRYVLPCLPLAYTLAAMGLAKWPASPRWRVGAAALLAGALLEALPYVGNPLSFSNVLVWPKARAFRFLVDSNLDWGQNDERIHEELRRRGMAGAHFNPRHLLPGRNIFSVTAITRLKDFERHRWVRETLEPTAQVGHTHVVFDADPATYERFLNEQRMLPSASELCRDLRGGERLERGSRVSLRINGPPLADQHWVLCIGSRKGGDVGLQGQWGNAAVGAYVEGSGCQLDRLGQGDTMWWRAPAGTSAVCVDDWWTPVKGLARDFGAVLRVRGRSVTVSMARAGAASSRLEPEPFRVEDGFVLAPKALGGAGAASNHPR